MRDNFLYFTPLHSLCDAGQICPDNLSAGLYPVRPRNRACRSSTRRSVYTFGYSEGANTVRNGSAQIQLTHGIGTTDSTLNQRKPLPLIQWLWLERTGSRCVIKAQEKGAGRKKDGQQDVQQLLAGCPTRPAGAIENAMIVLKMRILTQPHH